MNDTTMATIPPVYSEGVLGAIKGKLVALTAVIVVIPSLINASLDVYHKIADMPVGEIERVSREKAREHFLENPQIVQPVSVKLAADVTVEMKVFVYPNGDLFVKSGNSEQWLPFKPVRTASSFLISEVYADDTRVATNQAYAGEQHPLVIDAEKLGVARSLQQSADKNVIQQDYLLAEIKDNHPEFFSPSKQTYEKRFSAENGYVIKSFNFDAISKHHADLQKIELVNHGRGLRVVYSISSGPTIAQWSGWIKGTIKTTQEKTTP